MARSPDRVAPATALAADAAQAELANKIVGPIVEAFDAQTLAVPVETMTGRVSAEIYEVGARQTALVGELKEIFVTQLYVKLLRTRPGIGFRTGARILGEIGDGSFFISGDRLTSYALFAPVSRRSGKSINGKANSSGGNHQLNSAVFLSAFASLLPAESKASYDPKRAEGKRHNGALICLTGQCCNATLVMLAAGKPYHNRTSWQRHPVAGRGVNGSASAPLPPASAARRSSPTSTALRTSASSLLPAAGSSTVRSWPPSSRSPLAGRHTS